LPCYSMWNMCHPCCCHVAPALMKVGRATAAMYFFACFLSLTASSVASTCSSLCSSLPASVVCHGWRAKTPSHDATRQGQARSLLCRCYCSHSIALPFLFLPCERVRALEHRRGGCVVSHFPVSLRVCARSSASPPLLHGQRCIWGTNPATLAPPHQNEAVSSLPPALGQRGSPLAAPGAHRWNAPLPLALGA